jgi:hypothetical protein
VAKIAFPFWIILEEKHVLNPPAKVPCDSPFAVHAFSTTDQMSAFLEAHKGGQWRIDLVDSREALVLAVAELHRHEVPAFCLDPKPDGSDGELVTLADALSASRDSA